MADSAHRSTPRTQQVRHALLLRPALVCSGPAASATAPVAGALRCTHSWDCKCLSSSWGGTQEIALNAHTIVRIGGNARRWLRGWQGWCSSSILAVPAHNLHIPCLEAAMSAEHTSAAVPREMRASGSSAFRRGGSSMNCCLGGPGHDMWVGAMACCTLPA